MTHTTDSRRWVIPMPIINWLRDMRPWVGWCFTVPNLLTSVRLVTFWLPLALMAIGWRNIAFWAFVAIIFTDMADGAIAKVFTSQRSDWGAKWDPRADAWFSGFTILGAFIFLPFNTSHIIEMIVTVVIIIREIVIQVWRRNGDLRAPKPGFERTKFFVYMVATAFMLARFTHVEIWWNSWSPLSLWWSGFVLVVFVDPFVAYLATIKEKAAETRVRAREHLAQRRQRRRAKNKNNTRAE